MAFNFINRSTTNVWKNSTTEDWIAQYGRGYLKRSFIEPYTLPFMLSWDERYDLTLSRVINFYEEYAIPWPLVRYFDLYYGANALLQITELYADNPVPLQTFNEPYGNMYIPLKGYTCLYGDTFISKLATNVDWNIQGDLYKVFDEIYPITNTLLLKTVLIDYDISDYNKVLNSFNETYYILDGNTQYINQGTTVTVKGKSLDFLSLSMNTSEDSYLITGDISLATEDDYRHCEFNDLLSINVDGITFNMFIESKSENTVHESRQYSLSILSITAKLDTPYSATITKTYPSGISSQELAQEMCDVQNITLDYQLPDWDIPSYAISINRETPIAVLRRLVQAIGGIIQTKPDGTLLLISKYPVSVTQWESEVPTKTFDLATDLIGLSYSTKIVDGYNAYNISDQGYSSTSITLEEENVNSTTKIIKGYRIPFADGEFDLETSGGSIVMIDKTVNPVEEQIPLIADDEEWETIEFIEFIGKTSKPIYEVIDYNWITDDLGAFQISEDGTLTIIDQSSGLGASLLKLKYKTKYWKWTVTCPEIREVQFYVPEVV